MDLDTWGSEIDQDDDGYIFLSGNVYIDGAQKLWLLKLAPNGIELYNGLYGDDKSNLVSAISTLEDNALGLLTNSAILDNTTGNQKGTFYFIKLKDLNITQTVEVDNLDKVKLYPNPGFHFVDIEIPESENIDKLSIHNYLGEEVQSVNAISSHTTKIDVQNLSTGLYTVAILSDQNNLYSKKLIVKRQ